MNKATLPHFETSLPELIPFVAALAQAVETGQLDSWPGLAARVQTFFTEERLNQMEVIAPGWRQMSACGDGITLVHVMLVFTGLLLLPEYNAAGPGQQALLKWAVLFHDLAKQVEPGRRDNTHGFRSAAIAAQALPHLGFPVTAGYPALIRDWVALTNAAVAKQEPSEDCIQDNARLPQIIAGIEKLFGRRTPAALIVQTVLLHMSLDVVSDWPQAAPLSEAEISQVIDAELLPLLKIMMLADNDGWSLFDRPVREQQRRETLAAFEAVETRVERG